MVKAIKYNSPEDAHGTAIDYVSIDPNGEMWVGNGEYASQVNFNPWTGEPAPKQMKIVKETDKSITYE